MPKNQQKNIEQPARKSPPALTPEGREQQLVSMAMDLAEKRMMNGTASAQEVTHFLKAGSINAQLEREILKKQKELMTAKTENLRSQKRVEELYSEALLAMRSYSGESSKDEPYD